ncbi:MAG: azurin [Salegentibacter sp.]|uniref:Azurin n=1 Tax=Salegentibacter flavus TaxID=287099 RepID=A0A1I5BVK0_9FLAO|nr:MULTISPECIES: azurin [Salegentibacter]MDR9457837.1 azurin [Salegentibacter sp.]SFN78718.1 azurin [Salegentibacter flavus]
MKNLSKFVLIFGAMAMIACGDKKEKDAEENTAIGTSTEETTQTRQADSQDAADSDVVEITIEGDDQMRFNMDEIKVKAGQTVRLTLKHVGQMDKNAMGHNWVLLTQGTEISEFGMSAMDAKANDYIPEGTDQVIAHTKMLGGGESDTIEFEAPEKGTYDFICSFPGHYSLMKGKFIVE